MTVAEVGRFEGVGRGVMGLLRLWKCAEKRGEEVSRGWRVGNSEWGMVSSK
jgi:hypothetical protein